MFEALSDCLHLICSSDLASWQRFVTVEIIPPKIACQKVSNFILGMTDLSAPKLTPMAYYCLADLASSYLNLPVLVETENVKVDGI